MLLDFGFLTEDASWRHRIWNVWFYDRIKKFKLVLNLKTSTHSHQISYETLFSINALEHKISGRQLEIFQVRQFRGNFQKIQNLKKFERFNRFWPNYIPKVDDWYIIFMCSFRIISQILRKLEGRHVGVRKLNVKNVSLFLKQST